MNDIQKVLSSFNIDTSSLIEPYGSGLINTTWKVTSGEEQYILQKVNNTIFKKPVAIAQNIRLIAEYLKKNYPAYTFVLPVVAKNENEMIYVKDTGYFRLFPFIKGSHSKDSAKTPVDAYEAAVQFGRFTRLLADFNINLLQITIPHFHDIDFRHKQFLQALKKGNKQRIAHADALIKTTLSYTDIIKEYSNIQSNPAFKLRVMHHDTKISNILFDENNKGLCVIDLDTIMPGYYISDLGDMIRTYICSVTEEEKDYSKIIVRADFYKAIVEGYSEEMNQVLSSAEKKYFFYSGKFMIYMQALRFLTDHLNNDIYYGAKYECHNFIRAGNQLTLLNKFMQKL